MSRFAPVTVHLYDAATSSLPTRLVVACMLTMLAPCVSAQVISEEEELALAFGDKATVSIATGSQQPLRRAPAVATVITAEDIRAMGATDLDEVLETVPGIHVSRSTQVYSPLYVIRGIYSDFNPQTLMLQNGVPMTTLFVGNRGNVWYGMPVDNIARIEVIRGPGSALYGADAFSGVINIITKTAADAPGTEVGARAGSFNTWDVWGQHGGKWGPLDVAAYMRVGQTDGFRETLDADTQSLIDSLSPPPSLSLAPGPVLNGYEALDGGLDVAYQKWRLRAGYKLRNDGQTGPGVASVLDPVGRARSERINADLSWSSNGVMEDFDLTLVGSFLHYSQQFPVPLRLFPPGAFGGSFPLGMFGAPNTWERQLRLSAVGTYSGLKDHNLRFGIGHDDLDLYRTQEIKNFRFDGPNLPPTPLPGAEVVQVPQADAFMAPHRRRVDYFYVQDEWRFARDWTFTGGVRSDHYSDFGSTTNPRLAVVWDASLDWTAKLLYGRAFRAPAFTEQHSVNNPVVIGNPELRPETINTLELAFSWLGRADMDVNLSLFRYGMSDIIRQVDQGNNIKKWSNAGEQHGHGMELEATWKLSRALQLQGHYAWQRSTDDTSGQDAGYAPHHQLFGRVDWRVANNWFVGGQVNRVAGRKRAAGDTRAAIKDFTKVDLTARTNQGSKGWEFSAAVRNLFDADVREPTSTPSLSGSIPNDLPLPGRSFYLQASYRM